MAGYPPGYVRSHAYTAVHEAHTGRMPGFRARNGGTAADLRGAQRIQETATLGRRANVSHQPLAASANRLLAAVQSPERERFAEATERVELALGETLAKQDSPLNHVYFPLDSLISVVTGDEERANLQVGLVGCDGMLGATLSLGVAQSATHARVQGAGTALRMEAGTFEHALATQRGVHAVVQRYLYVTLVQLAQTTLCTHFHVLEARLARWLLMTHDRVARDTFAVTHAFLAYILGVRRVGVTKAASALQRRRLIHYNRGSLTIVDRSGLEAASCACYWADREAYARLMG